MVDPAAQALRHNRLLAAMPPNTLALLEPDLRQVSLEQGAILLEPGELIENIYFPLTGLISLTVIGKDGSSIEASTVGREGALACIADLAGDARSPGPSRRSAENSQPYGQLASSKSPTAARPSGM